MKQTLQIALTAFMNNKNLWIILTVINVLMLIMYASIAPSLQEQNAKLNDLMQSIPQNFLTAFNIGATMDNSYDSFLVTKQFSLVLPILLVVLVNNLAGKAIAKEIDSDTILLYLTQPISRAKYFWARYLTDMVMIITFSALSVLPAILFASFFEITVEPLNFFKYTLSTILLGWSLYSIGILVSSLSSETGKVTTVVLIAFGVSYFFQIVSKLMESLDGLKYLSLLYYFGPSKDIVEFSIPVFILVSIVTTYFGYYYFTRRDISVR